MECFKGNYNSLSEFGVLIKDPKFLFSIKGSKMKYGTFKPPSDLFFEYLIYRTVDNSLRSVSDYIKEKEPEVKVLTIEKKYTFEFRDENWELIKIEPNEK